MLERNPRSTAKIAGHPIHPMLVGFPIAFLVSTLVCDLVYLNGGNPGWAVAALWMVGAQVALSVVLVVGAGLFVQTVRNLARADLGYDPRHLIHVELAARTAGIRPDQVPAVHEQLLERVAAVRTHVGPDVRIAVDAYWGYSPDEALDLARQTDIGFHLLDRIYGELKGDWWINDDEAAAITEKLTRLPHGRGPKALLRAAGQWLLGRPNIYALPSALPFLRLGETVKVGYVDQSRDALGAERTVWEEITGGADEVELGKRTVASRAYVSWFNFKGRDQQRKVGSLSGGERNRVHLAKLLRRGANMLLLDEPTNDLDVDTLRALEEALLEFAGCVVVITHDRWFLDRIATHMLAFEGDSQVVYFDGNYSEYEADRKKRLGAAAETPHRIKYRKLTR